MLAENPKSDIDNVLVNEDTHQIQAVKFDYLKPERKVLDPSIQSDFDRLAAAGKGEFSLQIAMIRIEFGLFFLFRYRCGKFLYLRPHH